MTRRAAIWAFAVALALFFAHGPHASAQGAQPNTPSLSNSAVRCAVSSHPVISIQGWRRGRPLDPSPPRRPDRADHRQAGRALAFGFKQYKMGEVIGARTTGAVLAATAFLLTNGDLLLLAVDDVEVDGQRLEGTGVEPTIPVPFDSRYAGGRDPQLDRAVELLSHGSHG